MTFKDEICTLTTVNFSFMDKVRILLGRKVTVSVNVQTENLVGAIATESFATVEKFRKNNFASGGGYSELTES